MLLEWSPATHKHTQEKKKRNCKQSRAPFFGSSSSSKKSQYSEGEVLVSVLAKPSTPLLGGDKRRHIKIQMPFCASVVLNDLLIKLRKNCAKRRTVLIPSVKNKAEELTARRENRNVLPYGTDVFRRRWRNSNGPRYFRFDLMTTLQLQNHELVLLWAYIF